MPVSRDSRPFFEDRQVADPSPKREAPMRWLVLAMAALGAAATAAGCGGGGRWADLRGGGGAERMVYEEVARFLHTFYVSPSMTPAPMAWCLAVGRNSRTALRLGRRARVEPWLPNPRLLGALADLEPAVRPISDCGALDGDREVLLGSRRPAVAMALSQPRWQGDYATVQVRVRESLQVASRFNCRLGRTLEGWEVMECI